MRELNFVSDAFDILHDLHRIDQENRGKMTSAKRQSIKTMANLFKRSPDVIAQQLNLNRNEVDAVLESTYSLALSPR